MKKVFSFLFTAGFAVSAYSQTLLSDDFNNYNVGNLGTQGGWQRFGAGTAQAKIAEITAATYSKSLQFPRTSDVNMWIFKDLTTAWENRTPGNNILELKFDFYTGSGSGITSMQMYNLTDDLNNIGFLEYDHATNGFYFYDDSETILDLFGQATENTWYNFTVRYNHTTGAITISNGNNTYNYTGTPNKDIVEFDLFTGSETLTSAVDNIQINAVSEVTLAVNNTNKSIFNIYPNPVTDVINILSDKNLSTVCIYDAAGRIALQSSNNTINVENLAKGTYIVSIKYADGSVETKKIVKK